SGRDAGQFLDDLEEHARALLVAQVLGEVPSELRVTPEQHECLAEQSRVVGRAQLVRLLDLLAAAMEARKAGADARIQLELALVKAAAPDLDPSQRALLARVERLEQALPGERPAAVEPPPAAPAPRRAEAGPEAAEAPPALSGDELVERVMAEFDAEEILPDDDREREGR